MSYDLSQKKILVTGATGFIGQHVVRMLLTTGAHVKAFARDVDKSNALKNEGAEIFIGDLSDHTRLWQAVEGCQAVLHLGGVLSISSH